MGIWTKTSSGWVEIGGGGGSDGLEGLGGWAVITEVSGSPKRYAYNDGGTDWVAFEWTLNPSTDSKTSETGSFTTSSQGLAKYLAVGGGNQHGDLQRDPGTVLEGLHVFDSGRNPVKVGWINTPAGDSSHRTPVCTTNIGMKISAAGGQGTGLWRGAGSTLNQFSENYPAEEGWPDPAGNDLNNDRQFNPLPSTITGEKRWHGGCSLDSTEAGKRFPAGFAANTGYGWGKYGGTIPTDTSNYGCAVVCVPAAQAAGVDPGSWVTRIDYYAEVTDGIVTDLYQERFYGDDTVRTENGRYASPEQPDDLIPCDPSVAEGWTYADGEFTPPPPDPSWREQAIEALKQQLKDLQKDT